MTMQNPSIIDALRARDHRRFPPPAMARAIVIALARRFVRDPLSIVEGGRSFTFGPSADGGPTIVIRDERAWPLVLGDGSAGLGEAFIRDWWRTDDLTGALRSLSRAIASTERYRTGLHRLAAPLTEPLRRRRSPDRARDRENIAAHYDLGNDFFELLLDPTMMYSSGWFDSPDESMEVASIRKMDRMCRSLELSPGMRVVEIGTGWGGFAIHAARHYGVHVTTTTISREQFTYATERVRREGLEQRIDVVEKDYRDLDGTFDRVVSIEMIEAVDWRELDGYFDACASLLQPEGSMGLQAILIDDDLHDRAKATNDFIKEFIFPGGCLPSFGSIGASSAAAGLAIARAEWFGDSYAETLRRWRTNLHHRKDDLVPLGLDDAFVRMWEFYLCYCEAGFEERSIDVAQIVLRRPAR